MRYINTFALIIILSLNLLGQKDAVLFRRVDEPNEKALSLLVPDKWIVEGGAIRLLDPAIAGASNMIDCKFDLTVKSDASGTVMIRWLPEIMCIDQMKAFGNPEGAIFNNTIVRRKRDPVRFILEVAIPYAHPGSQNVQVIRSIPLPDLAKLYTSTVDPALRIYSNISYLAAIAEFSYTENGKQYVERMVTAIEDWGSNGGGMWKNRGTMLIRAPVGQVEQWEPILEVIQNSGIWNTSWIAGEVNGQRKRAGQMALTQKEIQELDNSINKNRSDTNAEINKGMYLNLTGQEDYINPFTGKAERDINSWEKRWINEDGTILYTNDPVYDPNMDPNLQIQGFKLSNGKR